MAQIRYESLLVEQALAQEYSREMERTLRAMKGLNDIKTMIREFEKEFASYIGVKNAVAVNSGSDALKMALLLAGIGPEDEVIIPDLTYQAVALAVIYCGATPVMVDALRGDLQMDPEAVQLAITPRTKALIGAHMFGRPCDVERLGALCREHKIVFIEDVCQAESSCFQGRMLGSFGDMAAFSFSYYKPLSSCGGGGGMIVADDDRIDRIRRWMEDWRGDRELLQLGQRFAPLSFMDLIALRVKLGHIHEIIASRQKIKSLYEQELGELEDLVIFQDVPETESVPQNFVLGYPQRDLLMNFLQAQGVMVQRPYPPIHLTGLLSDSPGGNFPISEWYAHTCLHLPLYSFMTQAKARDVVRYLRWFLENR